MDKILGVLAGDGLAASRNDDDFTDRLQYRFTTMLLIMFAVVVTTNTYVGDPIKCWAPAHFSDNWETYANHYCWVRNTYYLPFEHNIPKEHEDDKRHMITYYQWMPIILLVMALFFYLPVYFWRTVNARSGLDLNAVIETGEAFQVADKIESKNSNLEAIAAQMDRYLSCLGRRGKQMTISIKSIASRTCCMCCGRHHGNYLTTLYLVTKLLYIANAVLQLFALNIFMGHNFSAYGVDVIAALLNGDEWIESYRFPRVTMCDFNVRRLGNVNRYTLQCVLPINLFNEKIFLFVWFWIVFVIIMSCVSLIQWVLRAVFVNDGRIFVKKHLEINGHLQSDSDDKKFRGFMKYMMLDGVFVLRLLGHNTNGITVTDVAGKMFEKFKEKHYPNRELEAREEGL